MGTQEHKKACLVALKLKGGASYGGINLRLIANTTGKDQFEAGYT